MLKFLILSAALFLTLPYSVYGQNNQWYFPIAGYESRQQYKTFNQYWVKSDYRGKEALFPTQFTGYHAADDLEINKGEKNQDVPVYAVADGKITLAGSVSGYGGLILLNIANDSHTALYGHIKLSSLKVKAGSSVKAGQELAALGKGFSSDTAGERKHLHFGIYNGKGVYYRGYESSEAAVRSKWVDPGAYLRQKGAVEVSDQLSVNSGQNEDSDYDTTVSNTNVNENVTEPDIPAAQPDQIMPNKPEKKGLISNILQYFENLFNKIKSVVK